MRKISIILFVLCAASYACHAQESQNLFYAEIGGAGPIGSVNYERQLSAETQFMFRAGLGFVTSWGYSGLTLPLGLSHLTDLNKGNYLELGFSYTTVFAADELGTPGFFLPAIGYRKFYEGKKGFFRFVLNPIIFNDDPVRILPWAGISFGTRF